MSDKKNADYKRLLDHLGCKAENLLMIGNSIKSDIIPILELGGYATYVPHHVTWAHEQYEGEVTHSHFIKSVSYTHLTIGWCDSLLKLQNQKSRLFHDPEELQK